MEYYAYARIKFPVTGTHVYIYPVMLFLRKTGIHHLWLSNLTAVMLRAPELICGLYNVILIPIKYNTFGTIDLIPPNLRVEPTHGLLWWRHAHLIERVLCSSITVSLLASGLVMLMCSTIVYIYELYIRVVFIIHMTHAAESNTKNRRQFSCTR